MAQTNSCKRRIIIKRKRNRHSNSILCIVCSPHSFKGKHTCTCTTHDEKTIKKCLSPATLSTMYTIFLCVCLVSIFLSQLSQRTYPILSLRVAGNKTINYNSYFWPKQIHVLKLMIHFVQSLIFWSPIELENTSVDIGKQTRAPTMIHNC